MKITDQILDRLLDIVQSQGHGSGAVKTLQDLSEEQYQKLSSATDRLFQDITEGDDNWQSEGSFLAAMSTSMIVGMLAAADKSDLDIAAEISDFRLETTAVALLQGMYQNRFPLDPALKPILAQDALDMAAVLLDKAKGKSHGNANTDL